MTADDDYIMHQRLGGYDAVRTPDIYNQGEQEPELTQSQKDLYLSEMLQKMLQFVADGINLPASVMVNKRIQVNIPFGHTIEYFKKTPDRKPFVQLVGPDKAVVKFWEPARLKSIYKPRAKKGDQNPKAEIMLQVEVKQSAAARVGTRMIACAMHGGIDSVRKETGAGIAKKSGFTRQNFSLISKAIDEKIKEESGAKSGSPVLRQKPDPRKGMAMEEIRARGEG